jgi:hypothetical protein
MKRKSMRYSELLKKIEKFRELIEKNPGKEVRIIMHKD